MNIAIADTQPLFARGLRDAFRSADLPLSFNIAKTWGVRDLSSLKANPSDVELISSSFAYAFIASTVVPGDQTHQLRRISDLVKIVMILDRGEDCEPYARAKVSAIIFRDITMKQLVSLINRLDRGERYLCMDAPPARNRIEEARGFATKMSPREKQLALCVRNGMKNNDIAKEVGWSEQVVKNYLRNLFYKLGIHTRLELAMIVAGNPILESALANPDTLPEPEAEAVEYRQIRGV